MEIKKKSGHNKSYAQCHSGHCAFSQTISCDFITKLKTNILILTLVLSTYLTFGQTVKPLTAFQQDSLFSIKWNNEQDSLRAEFYKQPKLIQLTFEKNGKSKPFKGRFFISVDSNEFELQPNNLGQYEVCFTVDTSQTIILKAITDKETFTQKLSRPTQIKNGATVVFGIVTDIQKQSRKGIRKPRNEDDEISTKDEIYNSFFEDENILSLARQKKIKRIEYVQVTPRVYGCGTSTKYVKY